MKRNDFVALIGYDGRDAIVDREFAAKYGGRGAMELAEMGYYKAALCAAIYQQGEACRELAEWLHRHDIFPHHDCEGLKALFGVWGVEEVDKVIRI